MFLRAKKVRELILKPGALSATPGVTGPPSTSHAGPWLAFGPSGACAPALRSINQAAG